MRINQYNEHKFHDSAMQGERLNKLSLYNYVLSYGRLPEELVKMNSLDAMVNSTERSHKQHGSFVAQKATFSIVPPNTTLTLQRSLTILTDLEQQDIFEWYKELQETANSATGILIQQSPFYLQ